MTDTPFPPTRFQSFEDRADPSRVAPRLAALRHELAREKLDAFLVPRADAHRGESVPASEARLAYVTGFTGSAGIAVIGRARAALFVDSRYTLQAPAQTDTALIEVREALQGGLPAEIGEYAQAKAGKTGRIGYDPWLHTPGEIRDLAAKLGKKIELVPVANLVDRIWSDRPAPPTSAIEMFGHNRAGVTTAEKLADLQAALKASGADATVLTLPESICWLFNMRGRDVPNTPFVLSFAIVPRRGEPTLFLDAARAGDEALAKAFTDVAKLRDARRLPRALEKLGKAGKSVQVDPASVPEAIAARLREAGATLIEARDPVLLPKARKNPVELSGMREAQRLDAVALAKFLHWFDAEAPKGELTEIGIVTALEAFRREEPACFDASFDTIAGAGPHGAVVHYRVTRGTDRGLAPGELMLIDSGAQYLTGTTDITRTLATGEPSAEQKDRFTRVLKGMIGISTARFPKGTTGAQIDILARRHLWEIGETYHHGTGHGVGHVLSVHEGPAGISPRYATPLEPGMVLSNEPGFYKAGEYGIRIENLIAVKESEVGAGYLDFETLTLTPIDRRLIEPGLLAPEERAWLDAYHARVREEIGPLLAGPARDWLEAATAPLS